VTVEVADHLGGIARESRERVHRGANHRHHDRRRRPVARHVRDDDAELTVGKAQHVVVVAPRVEAGAIVGGERGAAAGREL